MSQSPSTITIQDVREALGRPLPGIDAQMRMAPAHRRALVSAVDPFQDCRHAGVLLLLYPCEDGLCLVLTRRTESVENHRGQISLPGGRQEDGETAIEAALREAWEECSVDPAQVEVLGQLSRLYVPPSGYCIHPVVGFSATRPAFVPFPGEVAEIIEEPLAHLVDNGTCTEEIWQINGQATRVPFYAVGRHKVWGATAMVLCEFLALLTR